MCFDEVSAMLKFRKAQKNDIDAVAKIYSDIHSQEENGIVKIGWIRDVYPTRETAENSLLRNDLFVVEDENGVVGSAIINQIQVDSYKAGNWRFEASDSEIMVLHTLVISPGYAGRGYGKLFVDFYEQYALSQNCNYLRMDTNAANERARAMYKKLGYVEIGITDCVFNGIDGVKLVLLEKKL